MNHVLWAPAAPASEETSVEESQEDGESFESLPDESGIDSSIEEESTQMDEDED